MKTAPARTSGAATIRRDPFGRMPDGTPIERFTLSGARDIELQTINYGGIITSLRVPDRHGAMDDVVLGHDTLEGYLNHSPYFGAIIGRYANRIERGRFSLDGVQHQLTTNDGPHHLHGGQNGLDRTVWSAEPFQNDRGIGVAFECNSPDGDQGYPGALNSRVTYTLTDRDELVLEYAATTDKPTPVNLTQHSYWNLAGALAPQVLGHELTIHAPHYTPADASLIPTGTIAPVADTPFDFRSPRPIGERIADDHEQLRNGKGYDHNFVLSQAAAGTLRHAIRLAEPVSGRVLDMHTTEPGVQFYSGNFLDGSIRGKGAQVYAHRSGLCLEAQHFPDSPNHSNFPSTVLRPGSEYRSRTVFAFSVH